MSDADPLENLSAEEQRELLARLLRERGGGPKFYPLSYAQERMWFLWRLAPDSPAYNIAGALRLRGHLDHEALKRALSEVSRRHEPLRTTFSEQEGRPRQIVSPPSTLALPLDDLRQAEGRGELALRLCEEEARRPFDLRSGPLLRARLLRLAEDDHVLTLAMHHIISDGWSLGVFLRELGLLYGALARGEAPRLPDLPVQYADYAAWQRRLPPEETGRQLAYWRDRLAGVEPLELPTDRKRPAVRGHAGARVGVPIGAELSGRVREAARATSATPFVVLLAAFAALLARYTGQRDVAVGTPVAGRNRAELEGLVGLFVNTLVLRVDLSGDPTFGELLGRVREAALGAYAHQDVPFERVVEELQPERDISRPPLFQVMIALRPDELSAFELPGVTVEPFELPNETAQFDLTLSLLESTEGFRGVIEYSTDLFDRPTVERLSRHYARLLSAAVSDPSLRVSDLPLLDESELEQQLYAWNDTRRERRRLCVHQLFEEQAARTPDAVAVEEDGVSLSYAELDRRAEALAGRLRAAGVRGGRRVGLLVEARAGAVSAMLAVMKAGGTYVPLDPTYPRERLERMADDAGLSVLLTEPRWRHLLPRHAGAVVWLGGAEGEETGGGGGDPRRAETADDRRLAYVMYTSGSTGTPKGVMISHRGLSDRVQTLAEYYRLRPGERLLQFVSLSFDASAEEIFPVLVSGATLVFGGGASRIAPAELLPLGERLGITVLHLPAAYWHEVAASLSASRRAVSQRLKLLIVGGESVRTDSLLEWVSATRHQLRFVNAYGPTEATITSTVYEVPSETETVARLSRLPIGRPLANTRAYVLDARMRPAPVGVPGELYLGGDGLARGYLGRPDLTAERFVPDPFGAEPGARLYRTGDRARWLSGGVVEFLGRADNQVKVRGFRIELGEVEAALRSVPGVRDCAVAAAGEGANRRLVAYVVAEAGGAGEAGVSAETLRARLRESLPEYMIPSAFVPLDALPLTPNGKVDCKALPEPEAGSARAAGAGDYVEPRNETERIIAGVWREVLGVERVGARDNFFDLGGHSLLLAQAHGRLSGRFARSPSMLDMFKFPTVTALARYVDQTEGEVPTDLSKSQERLQQQKKVIGQQKALQQLRKKVTAAAATQTPGDAARHRPTTRPPGEGAPVRPQAGVESGARAATEQAGGTTQPPGEDRRDMARFYDSINSELDSTPLGRYATFLNFGYVPNEGRRYSPVSLPQHYPNKNATNLVLEVVGDCDLRGRDVLDVGCGRGGTVATLRKFFAARRLVGLDLSANAIRFCREQFPPGEVEFFVGDAQALPFPDQSFDAVINVESSSSYPNLRDFYVEVFRVLRRGGHFLYTDLLPASTVARALEFLTGLGFVIERNQDITGNVLLSCDEAAARHLRAFEASQQTETIKTFLAVPGSRPYNEMRSGASKYFIVKAVKP